MTLSTAKLLKENGWTAKTEKYWMWNINHNEDTAEVMILTASERARFSDRYNIIPAPSTDELLAELNKVTLTKVGNNYSAICFGDSPMDCRSVEDLTDPSEALALLWIKLKQENIGG